MSLSLGLLVQVEIALCWKYSSIFSSFVDFIQPRVILLLIPSGKSKLGFGGEFGQTLGSQLLACSDFDDTLLGQQLIHEGRWVHSLETRLQKIMGRGTEGRAPRALPGSGSTK